MGEGGGTHSCLPGDLQNPLSPQLSVPINSGGVWAFSGFLAAFCHRPVGHCPRC